MAKKIVMQMQLNTDKCRSKALKIASNEKGVSSVALEGDSKDKLVVSGDVDAVNLGRVLRKKFCLVTVVSVEEVKKTEEKKLETKIEEMYRYCTPSYPPCGPYYYEVHDRDDNNCSIM